MPKLPILSGKKIIKALEKAGFKVIRQKGSHVILKKETSEKPLLPVVPLHLEIKRGTLLSILRQAKLTKEEFEKLL